MFGLGFPELLIILVIILVIFGAGKLPQVGEALGKGLSKFRGAMDEKQASNEPDKAVPTDDKKNVSATASDSGDEAPKV
ncbi:MAG: twin-arginine translocase TatA/TatE family subunit [Mariprofundaceae bacterium]